MIIGGRVLFSIAPIPTLWHVGQTGRGAGGFMFLGTFMQNVLNDSNARSARTSRIGVTDRRYALFGIGPGGFPLAGGRQKTG